MDKYTELYGWMWKYFGKEAFTIDEFRMVFPTSQAPKVIHDLLRKGYMSRVSRGTYRMMEPEDFVRNISEEEADERFLDDAARDYAFCDSTAVAIWTDGYYWTGFTKGFRPIHVAIREKDTDFWTNYLKKKGIRLAWSGQSRTFYGRAYILHPRKVVDPVGIEESRVVPLENTGT